MGWTRQILYTDSYCVTYAEVFNTIFVVIKVRKCLVGYHYSLNNFRKLIWIMKWAKNLIIVYTTIFVYNCKNTGRDLR